MQWLTQILTPDAINFLYKCNFLKLFLKCITRHADVSAMTSDQIIIFLWILKGNERKAGTASRLGCINCLDASMMHKNCLFLGVDVDLVLL